LQILPFTPLIWGLYSAAVFMLFTVIKLVNYRLHVMYDTGMAVEEAEFEDMGDRSEIQDHAEHGRIGGTLTDINDVEHSR